MTDYFPIACQQVFGEEGAPSDNPLTDPNGGLTRFGISQKQNPDVDVATLTQAGAVVIYRARYWDANRCSDMAWPVCLGVFDTDVNQGDGTGARLLQASLGVAVDGDVGDVTIKAVAKADPWELTARLLAKRGVAYTTDSEWVANGEGWMYRLASLAIATGRLLPAVP